MKEDGKKEEGDERDSGGRNGTGRGVTELWQGTWIDYMLCR